VTRRLAERTVSDYGWFLENNKLMTVTTVILCTEIFIEINLKTKKKAKKTETEVIISEHGIYNIILYLVKISDWIM